jgi:hypothetical protein
MEEIFTCICEKQNFKISEFKIICSSCGRHYNLSLITKYLRPEEIDARLFDVCLFNKKYKYRIVTNEPADD